MSVISLSSMSDCASEPSVARICSRPFCNCSEKNQYALHYLHALLRTVILLSELIISAVRQCIVVHLICAHDVSSTLRTRAREYPPARFIFLTSLCRDMTGYCYTKRATDTQDRFPPWLGGWTLGARAERALWTRAGPWESQDSLPPLAQGRV